MNITPAEEAKRLIEERRYRYFTFPVLGLTVKYRNPDVLKLSLNGSFPAALAEVIIDAYKSQMNGRELEEAKAKAATLEANEKLLGELREKGFKLLSELVTSHRILNVPQSDLDNDVIAWDDIPEEDAIAFLMSLINRAQTSTTTEGGEVSSGDIAKFPDGKRVPKRNPAG